VHPVERLDVATPHRRTGDRAPMPAALALPAADSPCGAARDGDTPLGSAKATTKPVVIVLPFVNLSDMPGQDYFADGVTADIIGRLCKHRWLDVVARNTSFGYRVGPSMRDSCAPTSGSTTPSRAACSAPESACASACS